MCTQPHSGTTTGFIWMGTRICGDRAGSRPKNPAAETPLAVVPVTPSAPGVLRPRRGSFDPSFWQELHARRKRGDPQRRRVYAWQREALGALQEEALLGEEARRISQPGARSRAPISRLWTTYAREFKPYYCGIRICGGICDRTAPAAPRATFGRMRFRTDMRSIAVWQVCGARPSFHSLPPVCLG
jgi:hypothetical protein